MKTEPSYIFFNKEIILYFGNPHEVGLNGLSSLYLDVFQLVLEKEDLICIVYFEHPNQLVIHLLRCSQITNIGSEMLLNGVYDNFLNFDLTFLILCLCSNRCI